MEIAPKKGLIGKEFRAEAKVVNDALSKLTPDDVEAVEASFTANG